MDYNVEVQYGVTSSGRHELTAVDEGRLSIMFYIAGIERKGIRQEQISKILQRANRRKLILQKRECDGSQSLTLSRS